MTKLVCQECQHENEPERIYCHSCGARLDRSSLAPVKGAKEESKETQRRLKQMLDPRGARARYMFFKISKLVLGAAGLAALIQILLPPDIPPRAKSPVMSPQINMDLETAVMEHRPPELRYSEEQVNAYLTYSLKSKQAALSKVLQFERALMGFDERLARVTIERSLFGFSIFTSGAYDASIANGKIVAKNKGGAIGRLPIHPAIMQYGDMLFADLWTALERDRKTIAKLGAIEFRPKLVVLRPALPAAPAVTAPPVVSAPVAAPTPVASETPTP
jgi:hypothetical protein